MLTRENVTLGKDPIIFVWNKEGKINDYISSDKPYSAYLLERHVPKRDSVIYNHNVGKSTCADWIRYLIIALTHYGLCNIAYGVK